MNRFICIALLIFIVPVLITGCGNKSETVYSAPPPIERKELKPSPSEVVTKFLNALKDENYGKAYKYVKVPYTDKVGYINKMKNTVADNDVSILSYRLLATQIYDMTATVVVELNTKLKSPKTGSLIEMTQKSQYSLGRFDDKWLVTAGNCIEGCLEREPVVLEKEPVIEVIE